MLPTVQIWAGRADLDEAAKYSGEITLIALHHAGGDEIEIVAAEPRVTATFELVEGYLCGALGRTPRLLDVLRIHGINDSAVYVVRGVDTAARLYYLEWPD
jgi:peptidoglycan/xylan/chitin deacetylase (PgdA/CDA1 family)